MRKSNLFSTAVFMLLIFSTIGFLGCEKGNLFQSSYSKYLELDSYELSNMSDNDMNTMGQALQRLDISFKNGFYQIKQISGAQVNISEELYDYITKGFGYTNKVIRPKSLISSGPRLKSGYAEPDTTYCVAYALAAMGEVDFEDVKDYIYRHWGLGGVPADSVESVVYHYFPNSNGYDAPLQGGPLNNAFIWYPTSDSSGHAVNGIFYDAASGVILYKDNQNNEAGYITVDSLSQIYYP